jgi:hypothetical protein
MQKVLAQRAMLEKDLRGHLVELVHQQQQIRSWLNMVSCRRCYTKIGTNLVWVGCL